MADYLFTGTQLREEQTVLICSEAGEIVKLASPGEAGEDIERFKGMLCPGFVNCHCHLELSHLKGRLPEKTGLTDFVVNVVTQRHFREDEIREAIKLAEDEMLANGIVAVGDICNNLLTFAQKQKQRLDYYNFIEVSGWLPQIAEDRFEKSRKYYNQFLLLGNQRTAMAPHAPYSVSDPLWQLISPYYQNKTTCIHNQESAAEDELFINGSGDLMRMYALMYIDNRFFKPSGKTSLQTYLHKLDSAKNRILVHNSYTSDQDISYLQRQYQQRDRSIYLCLCVNANQYIENAMPPIDKFRKQQIPLVLGTDSLASNWSLSILDEIKTILRFFPGIPLMEILEWATLQGARAIQREDQLGSFEPGKRPGVLLINNMDGLIPGDMTQIRRIL